MKKVFFPIAVVTTVFREGRWHVYLLLEQQRLKTFHLLKQYDSLSSAVCPFALSNYKNSDYYHLGSCHFDKVFLQTHFFKKTESNSLGIPPHRYQHCVVAHVFSNYFSLNSRSWHFLTKCNHHLCFEMWVGRIQGVRQTEGQSQSLMDGWATASLL